MLRLQDLRATHLCVQSFCCLASDPFIRTTASPAYTNVMAPGPSAFPQQHDDYWRQPTVFFSVAGGVLPESTVAVWFVQS